jgi:hypothetical protein
MLALQKELLYRVMPWVEDETPYCYLRPLAGDFCLSCLGFVMRILFPGPTPNYPALPRDFRRMGSDAFYTTEDLLLYLAGLHGIPTLADRLKRIDNLTLPDNLRGELVELAGLMNSNNDGIDAQRAGTEDTRVLRSSAGKSRSRGLSFSRIKPPRPSKNL